MIRQPDHPRVRAAHACPMCGTPKPRGAVTCWPCHNECENGTPEQRTARETLLTIAEAVMANPCTDGSVPFSDGKMTQKYERDTVTNEEWSGEALAQFRKQEAAQRRLDAPIPRRELLQAIDEVASLLGSSGWPERDMIADAFRQLAERLK